MNCINYVKCFLQHIYIYLGLHLLIHQTFYMDLFICVKKNILTVCPSDVDVYSHTHTQKAFIMCVSAVTEKTACSHGVCVVCLRLPPTIQRQTTDVNMSAL